ncbi:MAG: iron transporter [Dehalococcoidia bacterium]
MRTNLVRSLMAMKDNQCKVLLIIALSLGLLAVGTPIPRRAEAHEAGKIEVGKTVVGGMEIEVELEEPSEMRMLMMGKWKLMKPAKGDTHHLEVKTSVPGKGYRIPYSDVRATFINLESKKEFVKKVAPMFGANFHYGVNVTLKKGKYEAVIDIAPPTMMRMEESLNKWLKPVQARFQFEVK